MTSAADRFTLNERLGSAQRCASYLRSITLAPLAHNPSSRPALADLTGAVIDALPMQRPREFEFDPSPSPILQRWHPKLTPYRLLVLGTTISVGTAKAVAAHGGDQSASTTLEWVSGVVIFLILHSMSTYDESPKDPPPLLGWLFTIDCVDYIWRLLSLLRIPCPSYSSVPEPMARLNVHGREHTRNVIPVTLHRLFVSFITAVFGLTKATMTYSGYSVGANWVDWTLGVVVTSILFILGMYENNSIGMWHAFFARDHSTATRYGLSIIGLAFIFTLWIATCFWMMHLVISSPYSAFLSTDDIFVPLTELTPLAVLREKLFDACLIIFLVLMVAVSMFSGVASISVVMSTSGLPKWKVAADWIMGQGLAWKRSYMQHESPGRRRGKKIAYHTILLATFLLGCAVFLAFWVVSIAANVEEVYLPSQSDAKPNRGFHAFLVATMLFQLGGTGATAFLMWVVAWKVLLPPLWAYRRGDVDWDSWLLF
ncbi:hypothetical protein D9619_003933 [Psilocybe cf. subviscida]|uniref:Uncharacterized protein n=1 Tax=Psilocybe cf. subviscida TaxID=2480587 RepID=A0A8H5BPL9_9AGAR|nr:hypothetical protein D9619_003933 [Psilocybe cf. subviscida]